MFTCRVQVNTYEQPLTKEHSMHKQGRDTQLILLMNITYGTPTYEKFKLRVFSPLHLHLIWKKLSKKVKWGVYHVLINLSSFREYHNNTWETILNQMCPSENERCKTINILRTSTNAPSSTLLKIFFKSKCTVVIFCKEKQLIT